jgi:methionyl-tRNA formyltransferase
MEKLRIVFMGTPEFAVGILETILENKYNIVGVVTAPDKPAGRGQKIKYSAVKEFALKHQLKLLQPVNLKDVNFLEELRSLQANLQIVVAFRMLPKSVWEMPKLGTFNLHASLLPNYRGAAPINWAIINGETKTGVTTFFIDDKIDTGAMILKEEIEISNNENAGELHDRLMKLGSSVVLKTLKVIESSQVHTIVQDQDANLKTAFKLNKDNCKINWSKPGSDIFNLIRGLSPYPGAWCFLRDGDTEWNIKIYEATFHNEKHSLQIGQLLVTKKDLKIATNDGFIHVRSIQFPGKKKMTILELLNGIHFSENAYVF